MSKHGEVRLRPARAPERQDLKDLKRRASLANEADRLHLEAHPEAIELPLALIERGEITVAELDGRIAGLSVVQRHDGYTELDGLFVEPDLWGNGVGRTLVDAATHEARRSGHALLVIAGAEARGFYERCGFTHEGAAQTRFGPALRMSR